MYSLGLLKISETWVILGSVTPAPNVLASVREPAQRRARDRIKLMASFMAYLVVWCNDNMLDDADGPSGFIE
jgi:hypothetical protein